MELPQYGQSNAGKSVAPNDRTWWLWRRVRASVRNLFSTRQVPRFLDDLLAAKARTDEHACYLRLYHRELSRHERSEYLEPALWLTGATGKVCSAFTNKTIALDLNDFHEKLQESTEFESAICAINGSMKTRPMHWPLRIRSLISKAKGPTVRGLIVVILEQSWPGFAASIVDADKVREQEKEDDSPSSPLWPPWKAEFPSESGKTHTSPDKAFGKEFEWLHKVPVLGNVLGLYDWSLYILEPFAKPPVMDTIKVIDATPLGLPNRRIAVVASSHQPLISVRRKYENVIEGVVASEVLEFQLESLMCAILSAIKEDIALYMSSSAQRVDFIDMQSRRYPSVSKVQYLLHLSESHKRCAHACKSNADVAREYCNKIQSSTSTFSSSLHEKLDALSKDLTYLAGELETGIKRIDTAKVFGAEQIVLFDSRRTRVIGLLVAIYVPLAFTTSFFGMNIEDKSTGGIWTNATAKNQDWDEPVPFFSNKTSNKQNRRHSEDGIPGNDDILWPWNHNETAAANTTMMTYTRSSNLGTLTWPMWKFWVVACTLTLGSIVLPVIGGRIIRSLARISISRRKTFRAVASISWLAIYVPLVGAAFGPITLAMILDSLTVLAGMLIVYVRFKQKRWWSTLLGGIIAASTTCDILAWGGYFYSYDGVVEFVPAILACSSCMLAFLLWTLASPGD